MFTRVLSEVRNKKGEKLQRGTAHREIGSSTFRRRDFRERRRRPTDRGARRARNYSRTLDTGLFINDLFLPRAAAGRGAAAEEKIKGERREMRAGEPEKY